MGGMWYVLGVVALVAVVVAAISVLRRPSAEDLSSVRHYHSALGTLEHLSERNVRAVPHEGASGEEPTASSGAQPRFYRRPDAPGRMPVGSGSAVEEADGEPPRTVPRSSGPVPPASPRGTRPEPGSSLVFDDARLSERFEADAPALAPRSRMDRAQRHALDSMNHRPRRGLTLTVVAAVAVVVFAVLAIVGSRHSPKHGSGAATATTTHPPASTSPTAGPTHHRTTTTTAPSQLLAQSSTSGTAVYALGSSSYRVAISASGPCWVNATSESTGSTLWTGTMQAGGVQNIPATGTTRVELGTLAATLTVNGVPVVIPSTIHSPFVLTFEPSTSVATGPGASSTTTTLGPG